ncbi:MAG TPA: hypothetical protein VD971_01795 [Phycisphaerales bacterium]|nr:hypothetical protein [Phycisphaerales bacterium]
MAAGDNDSVIDQLAAMLTELEARRSELIAVYKRPPGSTPIQRRDNKRVINGRISELNMQIGYLEMRRRERELARDLGTAVPRISAERRAAMEAALNAVSVAVGNVKTLRAVLNRVEEYITVTASAEAASHTNA